MQLRKMMTAEVEAIRAKSIKNCPASKTICPACFFFLFFFLLWKNGTQTSQVMFTWVFRVMKA